MIESAPDAAVDGRWFERLQEELGRFVRARIADPSAAEDVLQDALLRIVRGLTDVRDGERLGPWAYAVARSAVHDHYRRSGRQRRAREALLGESTEPAAERDETPVASRLLAAWLPSAIEALPEPYRSTLRHTELEGVSYAQLAAREGVSVSAIKSRVSRGRGKLREAAERCCELTMDARGTVIGMRGRRCGCDA